MTNTAQHQAEQQKALELAALHAENYAKGYQWPQGLEGIFGAHSKKARQQFLAQGFPTPRSEEWRFTNLNSLAQQSFVPPQKVGSIAPERIAALKLVPEAVTLVFVDGILRRDLSEVEILPEGVRLTPLHAANAFLKEHLKEASAPLEALNIAFPSGGYVLEVMEGASPKMPLELLFISTGEGQATHSQNYIYLQKESALSVYQTFSSIGELTTAMPNWQNDALNVTLQEGANLHFFSKQQQAENGFFTGQLKATLKNSSQLTCGLAQQGAALGRVTVEVELQGEDAIFELYGFSLTGQNQHHSVRTKTVHFTPQTKATQLVRNVVAPKGHSAFMGNYTVLKEAQHTEAEMLNENLLLGPRAKADYKPELEIFADDVRCSHGATTGRLDEDAVFYMQSRGVKKTEAEALLTRAFVAEVLEKLPHQSAKEKIEADVSTWFESQKVGGQ